MLLHCHIAVVRAHTRVGGARVPFCGKGQALVDERNVSIGNLIDSRNPTLAWLPRHRARRRCKQKRGPKESVRVNGGRSVNLSRASPRRTRARTDKPIRRKRVTCKRGRMTFRASTRGCGGAGPRTTCCYGGVVGTAGTAGTAGMRHGGVRRQRRRGGTADNTAGSKRVRQRECARRLATRGGRRAKRCFLRIRTATHERTISSSEPPPHGHLSAASRLDCSAACSANLAPSSERERRP